MDGDHTTLCTIVTSASFPYKKVVCIYLRLLHGVSTSPAEAVVVSYIRSRTIYILL